ncbi:MAG: nitrogenase-stabilizing/protective protein NifW [Rhodocyclales bacterium]|nr:nitrogenase-stabilizing/protective protein NifW [Rhodocyclales bacterium]
MNDALTIDEALAELCSAEDFLDYFGIAYDPAVLQVNRLHILQRFHDYLAKQLAAPPAEKAARHAAYRQWLARAYADFVGSNAQAEKVFAVFRNGALPGGGTTAFVPLDKAFRP